MPATIRIMEIEQCCYSYTSEEFYKQFKTLDEMWQAVRADHAKRDRVCYPDKPLKGVYAPTCSCRIMEVNVGDSARWATAWLVEENGVIALHSSQCDSSD